MTLSVVYFNNCDYKNDPGAYGIRCCADSLITGEIGKLTLHAMKILPLTISYDNDYCSIDKKKILSHSIGFTYAGNLNVALNTYSLISYLCSHFCYHNGYYGRLPSMENIANLIAMTLSSYTWDYSLLGVNSLVDIVIFGYCTEENKFKTFHIFPRVVDRVEIKIEEVDLQEKQYFAIGSKKGKELLEEQVKAKGSFHPDMVRNIIKDPKSEEFGVGGFFQRGWSNKWGMKLYCDAMQYTPLGFGAPFCGFMVSPLEFGNHFIQLPMFGDSA